MSVETLPTVTKDPRVRFPSTWRPAIGKPLTNHAITKYARLGRYGKEAQLQALATRSKHVQLLDKALCCHCGQPHVGNRFLRFFYLPKTGVYCPLCLAKLREERDKDRSQSREWKERMMKEYA